MSDNIDEGARGARFAERNGVAWHKLARVRLPEGTFVSAKQALEAADSDYTVETLPLTYTSPTTGLPIETNRVAIVRPEFHGSPEQMFGIATTQFRPLQNHELAALLDAPNDDLGGHSIAEHWPIETIGAIRRGADLFVTLDAGTRDIGGDEVRQFLFIWNSHDGSSSLKVRITPIRVVCQNTCIMGDEAATIALDARHTQRIVQDASYAFDLVRQLHTATDRTMDNLAQLVNIRLTADQLQEVLEIAYPMKDINTRLAFYEANNEHLTEEQRDKYLALKQQASNEKVATLKARLGAWESYEEFNQTNPVTSKTGWALYNAITETECWKSGGSEVETARSILTGGRGATMARAYSALVALK